MNVQFNFSPHRISNAEDLVRWANAQMKLLSRALRGPVVFDAGVSGTAKTVSPQIADITELELTGDVTVTLSLTDTRKGMSGAIEFTQDGTGGRVVTFVNLIGTVPAITATADKRTLVLFTHVGDDGWVATVLASNY